MRTKFSILFLGMTLAVASCGGNDDDPAAANNAGDAGSAGTGGLESSAGTSGGSGGGGGSDAASGEAGGSTGTTNTAGSGGGGTTGPSGSTGSAGSTGEGNAIMKSVTASSVTLSWLVNGDSLDVKISAPTTGWVAVGWNPSAAMKDADVKIGYVSGGTAVVRDDFGTSMTRHASDESLGGTSDVSNIAGSESGGTTELSFTIPLSSGDRYDSVLSPGQPIDVIVAYGQDGADNFESYHAGRGSVNIEL